MPHLSPVMIRFKVDLDDAKRHTKKNMPGTFPVMPDENTKMYDKKDE